MTAVLSNTATSDVLEKLLGVTDKLRSLVTKLKSELQTELIRLHVRL